MNNRKFIRNIIVSVVVLAALAGTLIWVNSIPDEPAVEAPENAETKNDEIEIFKFNKEDVKSVKIENIGDSYTIVRNGDEYTIPEKSDIIYSSSELRFCFEDFLTFIATKDVTSENIPFEKNSQATITMNDGTQHLIVVGNEVVGESAKFVRYNDKTYVVPEYRLTYFDALSNTFRDTNLGKISANISSMKILENGKELVSFRVATEDDAKNFPVPVTYVMDYPKYLSVSSDRIQSLFDAIKEGYSLDIVEFVDDNIANASKYGIGKKTVIINDGEKEYRLDYGNKTEDGDVYAVVNGGKSIYTMSATLFDIVDKYNGDVIMDKLTHIVNLDDIKSISFEGKGEKYLLERKGKKDNYSYEINGTDYEEDTFKEAYREIIGINSDKIAYNGVPGTAEYTVTITYPDGKTDKWEYVSESERNYVLSKNKEAKYICLKKNVDTAMANIKKLLNK